MKIGDKVEAHTSSCIGLVIDSATCFGTIEKVNRSSIRVHFTYTIVKHGTKVAYEGKFEEMKTFKLLKKCDNGKMIFKNDMYGVIEAK